ncbi:metal-dependent hydrolase [Massilia eurypsychrophila]|jgi:predicted metal-dependent hydrolase|uniref:Metal-dependent hydrolase n=1 Tax=Massilia eurypsychrophila TaxID=1485217 RepID=A0A2G8TJD1_9BURK|nr:SprT family zinc-dependent metalloprotease [Massilia eurypsychrophila]PIL46142.1 metal-dependent hydrolase [Massilia eurypsychrophila]
MKSPKIDDQQLELFAQDFFAALEPAAPAPPPQALFKAPPAPPRVVFPTPPTSIDTPLRRIQLGSHALDYQLRRSTRRSIGFTIDDDGLRVTAPKRVTLAEIDNAIRAKQRWILTKLHERGERRALRQQKPPVQWIDGAQLPFMGGDITLRLQPAERSHCVFDGELRELAIGVVPGLSEWQLQERVRLWLQSEATRVFSERMDLYAPRLGVSYSSMTLSSAGTRWGSCTVDGSIRLNWRLIHFPLALIDYVVAHELAHLREMNHSARFWATVESVYPDYDGAKAALRKRSQELPVLFPD